MTNWFKRLIYGENIDHTYEPLSSGQFDDEGSVSKRLLYSLQTEPENWQTKTHPFSAQCQESLNDVMFGHKTKELRFKMSYKRVSIYAPVDITVDMTDSVDIYEYLEDIWDDRGMEKNFLVKYIAADNYYKVKIPKEEMGVFNIKLWCYNNLEGRYRIDPCPEPSPGASSDMDYRKAVRKRNKASGKYDHIICWFESKADMAQFKLTLL